MNTEFVKALAQFQGAVGNITRDASGMVGHRSYNYSTLGQIGPLSESGLAVVQVFDDQRLTTKLLHADGEIVSSMTLNLQGLSPQQAGAVISYFRRYQLSSLLCLATEEDTDAADVGEPVNGRASKLASTFSMSPPPPMGLKQQLIASIAEEGRKPAVVRGNGITLLAEVCQSASFCSHQGHQRPPQGAECAVMRTVMGTAAVGRLLGYSARRVRELIQEGSLGGVFINHRWIVTEQALKRFVRRRGLEL